VPSGERAQDRRADVAGQAAEGVGAAGADRAQERGAVQAGVVRDQHCPVDRAQQSVPCTNSITVPERIG
jgi:hypothetical protein